MGNILMETNNSTTLISHSFDCGKRKKKLEVFSKEIMQSSGMPTLFTEAGSFSAWF